MSTKTQNYNCTEVLLYTIATATWNACSAYLAEFSGIKAFYTPQFVSKALDAITDAKNLATFRKVITDRRAARVNLINGTVPVRSLWQQLKNYITSAYAKELVPSKLEAAGASLYAKASDKKWSAVSSLISAALNFMTDNLDELTANDNMPADFPATFEDAGDAWSKLATTFFDADNAKKMAVDVKKAANNAIYESLITMMKDGQQVFTPAEVEHTLFVFAQQLRVYSGVGSASLKGYIIAENKMPIASAFISTNDLDYKVTTDAKGRYSINRMLAGSYLITVTSPGYIPVEYLVSLRAGISSRLDVTLSSVMKKVA